MPQHKTPAGKAIFVHVRAEPESFDLSVSNRRSGVSRGGDFRVIHGQELKNFTHCLEVRLVLSSFYLELQATLESRLEGWAVSQERDHLLGGGNCKGLKESRASKA